MTNSRHCIAVVRGDGIGPEITDATLKALEASGARFRWVEAPLGQEARRRFGCELPWESLETIREAGLAIKAPLLAERMSGGVTVDDGSEVRRHASINNALRRELAAYVNLRPIRGWRGVSGRYEDLDVVIVREVSEGIYGGLERMADAETAEAIKRITVGGSRRVARFAFDYAVKMQRRKVSAIHKANVLHLTDGTFLKAAADVAKDYAGVEFDDRMVDAACYLMVKAPGVFDVLVTPNQYGDILSDLVAGLVGSLGLAPGANIGPDTMLFEASHGAAPDISGQRIANPIGLLLSGVMLLEYLGETEAAGRVGRAVAVTLDEGRFLTPDLGGNASTELMTQAICGAMQDG